MKDCPPNAAAEAATGPFLRVNVAGAGLIPLVFTKNDTVALAACLGRGTYPIFLAYETIFSLKVAVSMNTSLVIMLALYEVM